MPNTLNTIVYVHDHNEKPVNGKYFVVNAIGICRVKYQEDEVPLHLVGFYPMDAKVSCSLERFSKNDVVKISGKFVIKKNEDDEQVIKV